MNVDTAYESDYLRACDFDNGKTMRLKIKKVIKGELQVAGTSKKQRKPVIYFEGSDKMLALNKTNKTTLVNALGKETDNWHGVEIELFQGRDKMSGKDVDAVRIRNIKAPRGNKARQKEGQKAETVEAYKKTIDAIRNCDSPETLDAFLESIRKKFWKKEHMNGIAEAKALRLSELNPDQQDAETETETETEEKPETPAESESK
jgi:F0F1-type ATP synthase alpha subunit